MDETVSKDFDMSVSALETVRAQFKTALEAIVAGSTYRNTVKEVTEDIGVESSRFPSLTLLFTPDFTVTTEDDAWSLYDLHVPFTILCEIKAETSTGTTSNLLSQQDSLIQDVLHCVALNYRDNIIAAVPWNIQSVPNIRITPVYPSGENKGLFSISGMIHIRNLDNTFT